VAILPQNAEQFVIYSFVWYQCALTTREHMELDSSTSESGASNLIG
jgi:hypothetical protein